MHLHNKPSTHSGWKTSQRLTSHRPNGRKIVNPIIQLLERLHHCEFPLNLHVNENTVREQGGTGGVNCAVGVGLSWYIGVATFVTRPSSSGKFASAFALKLGVSRVDCASLSYCCTEPSSGVVDMPAFCTLRVLSLLAAQRRPWTPCTIVAKQQTTTIITTVTPCTTKHHEHTQAQTSYDSKSLC